ncbi:MAG: ABC transporter substrate-binding protein [Halovenus sp.]
MTEENDKSSKDFSVTRRRYVEALGVTGTAGILAGCSGDGDGDDGTGDDGTGDDGTGDDGTGDDGTGDDGTGTGDFPPQVDRPLIARFSTPPRNAQWNYYNTNNQASYGEHLLYSPLAWYSTAEGEYFPFLAEDWEWVEDGNQFRLHLADFWTWHNGNDFTADDVVTQLKLEQHLGGIGSEIETVEKVDDYTVDIFTPQTINNALLELALFTINQPRSVSTSASEYGDMLAEIENTEEGTSARDEALGAVSEYQEKPPIGTGPFAHSETQEGRVVLEPFEDYPLEQLQQMIADHDKVDYQFPDWALTEPNYPEVHLNFFADGSALRQAWFTGNIDVGSDSPPGSQSILDQYPDTHTMTLRPTFRGSCLCFDLEDPVFGQREIRRAMAHAMDVPSIAQTTYGATGFANTSASGMARGQVEVFMNDDFIENTLTSYAEQDFEAAEAELQSLADRHSDFEWDGNALLHQGSQITVPLAAPSTVDTHMNAMRQLQSWFGEVGFSAEINGTPGSQFWSSTMPNGDWTPVAQNYFGGAQPHPYYAYRNTYINGFLLNATHSPPETVEVPPIGEDSGSETVEVLELTEKLARPLSDEELTSTLEQLAWTWNQTLPYVPYAERHNAWMENMARFHFPHPDDKGQTVQRNPFLQPALGLAIARQNSISDYPYDTLYHSIEGSSVDGGMSLDESKSSIPFRDQSWE